MNNPLASHSVWPVDRIKDHVLMIGSGASTTHNPHNLPTLIAGGANMGLKHGGYWRNGETRMSNVHLSVLRSLGIEQESFSDSTGTVSNSIFSRV
jgi:hypothetical protein